MPDSLGNDCRATAAARPGTGVGAIRRAACRWFWPPAAIFAGALAGCSSGSDPGFTFLADPGKYEFYDCEQLARDRTALIKHQQDLKALMDHADQTTSGAAVGVLAYRADYASVGEDIRLLNAAARSKNCEQTEAWRSNSAIR